MSERLESGIIFKAMRKFTSPKSIKKRCVFDIGCWARRRDVRKVLFSFGFLWFLLCQGRLTVIIDLLVGIIVIIALISINNNNIYIVIVSDIIAAASSPSSPQAWSSIFFSFAWQLICFSRGALYVRGSRVGGLYQDMTANANHGVCLKVLNPKP